MNCFHFCIRIYIDGYIFVLRLILCLGFISSRSILDYIEVAAAPVDLIAFCKVLAGVFGKAAAGDEKLSAFIDRRECAHTSGAADTCRAIYDNLISIFYLTALCKNEGNIHVLFDHKLFIKAEVAAELNGSLTVLESLGHFIDSV